MQPEILKISYHVQRMVVKALNRFGTQKEAAQALGVSERTLINYKWQFKIEREGGVFVSKAKQMAMALLIILVAHCTPKRSSYNRYQVRGWFKKIDDCTYVHPYSGDTVVLASDGFFHIKK